MRRYPAFDPPEYVSWQADPALTREFHTAVFRDPRRARAIRKLGQRGHLNLYRGLLRFRLCDIGLARWVRQGIISKAWLGAGEEAVTVGAVHALDRRGADGDIVGPMIRNNGANLEMGVPAVEAFRVYLATSDSVMRGRDLHLGDLRHGVCPPISMVSSLAAVMNGFALAFKMREEPRVALTWVGDGASKHGEAQEAFAFAAALSLPVVFIIQANRVALGTPLYGSHLRGDYSGIGTAHGMSVQEVDGNNVLEVCGAVTVAAAEARHGGGPQLVIAQTFRMGGHATHDVREARATFPPELFAEWGKRDPVGLFEEYLCQNGETRETLEDIEQEVTQEMEQAAEEALRSRDNAPGSGEVMHDVYAAHGPVAE